MIQKTALRLTILSAIAVLPLFPALKAAEAPYNERPNYTRAMRLADMWSVADLVAVGSSRENEIRAEEILFGSHAPEDRDNEQPIALSPCMRVPAGQSGIWLLLGGANGHVCLNPELKPISKEEFAALARPEKHWTGTPDLIAKRPSDLQLYWKAPHPKSKLVKRHGPDLTSQDGRGTMIRLTSYGERTFFCRIESDGTLRDVVYRPEKGHGFAIGVPGGELEDFWHYKDGKRHGVFRRFYTSRNGIAGRQREEKHFTNGVVDGRWREWDETGKLVKDENFACQAFS
jgi:hypothetical protein